MTARKPLTAAQLKQRQADATARATARDESDALLKTAARNAEATREILADTDRDPFEGEIRVFAGTRHFFWRGIWRQWFRSR